MTGPPCPRRLVKHQDRQQHHSLTARDPLRLQDCMTARSVSTIRSWSGVKSSHCCPFGRSALGRRTGNPAGCRALPIAAVFAGQKMVRW